MLIDVLMVLIVAAFAAYGYRRGLMRSFAGVVSYLLSAVFAAVFLPAVSGYLKKTAMTQKIAAAVNEKYVSGSLAAADGGGLIAKYINKAAEGAADIISNNIAELIVSVIAFVAVLILARLVIMLLGKVFGVFLHLPIIKQANGLGGAALGGLLGVLVLYTAFAAAAAFVPLGNGYIAKAIEKSSFAKGMYEDNALLNIIESKTVGGINE